MYIYFFIIVKKEKEGKNTKREGERERERERFDAAIDRRTSWRFCEKFQGNTNFLISIF